jgi:hypothetical protein
VAQSQEEAVFQAEKAVSRLSAELYDLFFRVFGKEPNPEIIKEEAQSIVSKYGVVAEIKDIFNV